MYVVFATQGEQVMNVSFRDDVRKEYKEHKEQTSITCFDVIQNYIKSILGLAIT